MRATSLFLHAKGSERVLELKKDFMRMVNWANNPRILVFADEKPMKDIDIYGRVRHNVITPYCILKAVKLQKERACEALVFERKADSHLYFAFVKHLLSSRSLVPGDISLVDNCTIHMNGKCKNLQKDLWELAQILMVPLPRYHPELNPTEFLLNYLIQELRRKASRFEFLNTSEYEKCMIKILNRVRYSYVKRFYIKQNYI